MRHQIKTKKLNRPRSHRQSLLRNLTAQIIQYEHIDTTNAKAREVAGMVDKVINIGKAGDINAIRKLYGTLYDERAIKKILEVLADRFKDRNSGYTSIVKLGRRHGDNAEIVRIMLLEK